MSLGFTSSADWVAALLERPIVSEPGRTFGYDTGSTHLVSAALTRAFSQPAADVARARLFERMGIDADAVWPADPNGNSTGGWGLELPLAELVLAAARSA